MKTIPLVSVVMCVHNTEQFIREAVNSILKQSYSNFEFLIVDDASTDRTPKILVSFKDKRLKWLRNRTRQGVAYSLNRAISLAKGSLIARMDADDVSLPARLEKQIEFLKKHPDIDILGTAVELIAVKGKSLGIRKFPEKHKELKRILPSMNPLIHPTVIFRKKLIKTWGGYDVDIDGAEDYDLWLRFSRFTKLANLPLVLLKYRINSGSISFKDLRRIEKAHLNAKLKAIFTYHYPWWHILFMIKPGLVLLMPQFFKRKLYETFYGF